MLIELSMVYVGGAVLVPYTATEGPGYSQVKITIDDIKSDPYL